MFHHLIQRSLSCQCQQIARSVQIRTAAAPATLICNLISLLSPQMIIWASHQRCSLELPLGCETFMVECPSLRIVCELHLFMICVFCLHGTSFEKVSCTYRSQQFPVVLASLQTAEGVTNGASSAGGLREPLSARRLRTHCPSSQLLPVIFDSSSRKKQATLLTRSELSICAQNQ